MEVRNRIVEIKDVPGHLIRPNPKNWRLHPEGQKSALMGILAEVGIVDVLKVVPHPSEPGAYMLVDGHARAEILGDQPVKVAVLDLSTDEQKLVLATFDPIGNLAGTDQGLLDELIDGLVIDNESLMSMLEGLHSFDPGDTPDLNDVGDEHGEEPDDKLSWQWIKWHLPPSVHADLMQLVDSTGERDPVKQVQVLVDRIRLSDGEL